MKTAFETLGRVIGSPLAVALVLLLALIFCRKAEAAQFPLYIIPSSGTNIAGDAGSTNLSPGNNSASSDTNGRFDTLLSTTAPTDNNTRMQESYSNSGTWYSLGRAYYTTAYGSDVIISANATGKFYLRSSSTNDDFKFVLRDYNPAAGGGANGAEIATSAEYTNADTSSTAKTIAFGNSAYTLPAGHFVEVEIMFRPSANGRSGYVYCNDNVSADDNTASQSRINLEIRANIVSSAGANGSISPSGTTAVDVNTDKSYTITANAGYTIQSLTVDGAPVAAANGLTSYTYTFTNVTASHTINANFIVTASNLTITTGVGGTIAYPGGGLSWAGGTTQSYIIYGSGTLSFTVTPSANYGILEVFINGVAQGVPQGQTTVYTFNATFPGTNSISASFIRYYTVTSSAGAGGVIDPAGATPVLSGQSLTYAITPDPGYRILAITDNGVNIGNTSPVTISNVTANRDVVATFLRTHTITAIAGPNGTISPIGVNVVDDGGNSNIVMTPNLGFRINDVLVDGTSIGAVTSYNFTSVTANHTIEVSFVETPIPSTYCAVPPYLNTAAPPSVMLMLSVESPMEGAANPDVPCTGLQSSLSFNCSSSGLGLYDNLKEYYGYFESNKCYTYSGSGASGLFSPSGAATNHQCSAGTAWSGNMLNWATMLAVDAFRKAFTGGNRDTDIAKGDATYPNGRTVIRAATNDGSWFPVVPRVNNAELYMPVAGASQTRYIKRQGAGIGFGVCSGANTDCTVGRSATSGEEQWPTVGTNTASVYSLRILACDATGGNETRCNSTTNKPEGTIQKNMDKMRFALMSYAADNGAARDGGVLRSNMKWVAPKIPNGLKYHSNSGAVATCATFAGCDNPEREVNADGTLVASVSSYPEGSIAGYKSGVINYINKFGYASGYKGLDPMGELYYEVVRHFRNQKPSQTGYCSGLTSSHTDGFNFYCANSKTTPVAAAGEWRDPALYPCSQNYVIAINDANPWLDKRIPGSAFKKSYGGNAANDYCGSGAQACDADFLDGGTQVNVEAWTNAIGDWEGLTGTTMNVACEVDANGDCIGGISGGKNVVISKLGRIIGTPPYPAKENSYNVAGLAYYAHMTDLRPDLSGSMHNLTTYMIDTQEPQGNMLVGPKNMLYLAAKYGGFVEIDKNQTVTIGSRTVGVPFKDATCAVNHASTNSNCAEWDADDDSYLDNYYFASKAADVESGLNKAFASILNSAKSGTAAAVANNRSGERGANVIQAIFYPEWLPNPNIKWLGDVQALWFYLDPLVQYSNIYEDSDSNKELNLDRDRAPDTDSLKVKALWKAGEVLLARTASSRTIYTLLDSTEALTAAVNTFATANRATLKPLLDMSATTDATTDAIINYARGVDSGIYRSRTLTYNSVAGAWKLGDIINSTPQIQGSEPINTFTSDYNDITYTKFTKTTQYKANNYVYVGSNDGMLHAFRLGLIGPVVSTNKFRIARIVDDTDLGKEDWAFIPKNVLPYLKNCADANYCHQYLVDGSPLVFDASINAYPAADPADAGNSPACATPDSYWLCKRRTVTSSNNLVESASSWRTILLGSMGHGGATRDGNCNETLNHDADATNNSDCIKTPVPGNGYSSYFALDITAPQSPQFMWEFSDAVLPVADRGLGLTTPGPAIVRVNPKTGSPPAPDKAANGRWFAVFASGPTGPIDQATRQIKGYSDQNLKLYVVDLKPFNSSTTTFVKCTVAGQANCNYWVFDSGIKYAFSHTLYRATIDIDRQNSLLDGYYSDDVVYVTYNRASLDVSPDPGPYPTAWDKGGVLRLVTNNDPDPSNWFVSTLIDGLGPITSNVDILQDRNGKKLWLFFGEGRYFFSGDELNTARRIFGVTDPCYRNDIVSPNTFYGTAATCPSLTIGEISNQTTINAADLAGKKGWYINLTAASGGLGAERLYGKISAELNGVVTYPTFTPNTDICTSGGTTSLWATKYSTGGTPPASGLHGKMVVTTTSSPIPKTINTAGAFTRSDGRQLDSAYGIAGAAGGGGGGVGGGGSKVMKPPPVRKMLNVQER